jgi:Tol biopolymer transport system component
LYDRPYGETVPLFVFDEDSGKNAQLAEFSNHRPATGEFRCDLHPNPSPDGAVAAVNSLQDGGRQVYITDTVEVARTR